MTARCDLCPRPAGAGPCVGESHVAVCRRIAAGSASYRDFARSRAPGSIAATATPPAPYLSCPHAKPLTRARNCRDRICEARGGLIVCVLSDCRTCTIPLTIPIATPPTPPVDPRQHAAESPADPPP